MLPPLAFLRTHTLEDYPMLARYPLEEWQRSKHLYVTEKDWKSFTNPISTSKTELAAWLRAADGEVHESSWDRRSETSTDLPANPFGQLSARSSYASKPPPNQVNISGSSTSQGNSPNPKASPKTPPVSDTMATRHRHMLMSGLPIDALDTRQKMNVLAG